MKVLRTILVLLLAVLPLTVRAQESEEVDLDIQAYLFGHVGDAYEWHITTVNGEPVSIPLPVIVRRRTSGWHCFSSRHLEEGAYEGFYISASEKYDGKIVERDAAGEEVRLRTITGSGMLTGSPFTVVICHS